MHTDHTLPCDSIMTVDAYDRILDTYFSYFTRDLKGGYKCTVMLFSGLGTLTNAEYLID